MQLLINERGIPEKTRDYLFMNSDPNTLRNFYTPYVFIQHVLLSLRICYYTND